MIKRIISGTLGVIAAGNGALMLLDGRRWYALVPGVNDTGPFNQHFIADIGAAFLIAGVALIARAWRARYWPAAVAAAGFLAAHGLIHVHGLLSGHSLHAAFEWTTVVLPAALALWAAFPNKEEYDA